MAASPRSGLASETIRRRRYTPQPEPGPLSLTPRKRALLEAVGRLEIASVPQLARLTCPSEQSARRHLRELFDHGLVQVIPVSRYVLADGELRNDASLLFGSAPNIYRLTRKGAAALERIGGPAPERVRGTYGPRNTLFLAHALAIRDVRVWLELSARRDSAGTLERWEDGPDAEFPLPPLRGEAHKLFPDAWFTYRVGTSVLVGLVEVDRGTERGDRRWGPKVEAYSRLLTGGTLKAVTGYQRARILTFAPDARRRETLAQFVERTAPADLVGSFWFTAPDGWAAPGLHLPCWRRAGTPELQPLLATPRRDSRGVDLTTTGEQE